MLLRLLLSIELAFIPGDQYVSPQQMRSLLQERSLHKCILTAECSKTFPLCCLSLRHTLTAILCHVLLVLLEWRISVRITRASASLGASQPVLAPRRSTSSCVPGREGRWMRSCPSARTGFGIRRLPHGALCRAGRLSCLPARIAHPGVPPSPVPAWLPAGSPLRWRWPVPRPLPQLVVAHCPVSAAAPLGWQMFCKSQATEAASAFCPALPHMILLVFCSITQPTSFSRLYL